jgi:uncharacterized protein YndB with AHSA1/START domain
MIEIARERNIPAPAARVWEVVAEAERLPEWYARAASAEVLEGAGLGRRQRVHGQWHGQSSEIDQVITAFEPARLLEWRHEAERLGGQPAPRFATETVVPMSHWWSWSRANGPPMPTRSRRCAAIPNTWAKRSRHRWSALNSW